MKEIWFGFAIVLIFLLSTNLANAGLMLGENEVHLKTFDEYDICFGVWTGREGTTSHTVSFSDEIAPFVASFSPTEFELEPVPCPSEQKPRQACIKELCMNGTVQYCQLVCITFKGPFKVALFPEEEYYEGSVKDVSKKSTGSTTVVPYTMKVYYTPFDLKIIIVIVIAIITSIVLIIYFWKSRKPKETVQNQLSTIS